MRRVLCFQPHHSKPGAFIAQIAAMKTAFALGKITNVNANAVGGRNLSITGSGQRNPQLLSSKRPVNCALDFGDRILLVFGLAHLNHFRVAQ